MVRPGKERAAPPTAAAAATADADAADDDETQVTTQETRWRTGVNRQARPDAQAHQVAASRAAAEKRKANAMTPEQRLEKRAADKRRRIAEKKAAQEAASAGDTEAMAAFEAAEREADAALEEELEVELEERISECFGEKYVMDTRTRETIELELRAEGYGADRSDDGRQKYSLPHAELQRREADDELPLPAEAQMAWDKRVLRDRLARGASLGPYLEELQRLLRDPPHDPIGDNELANHGNQPSHWWPQGTETAPPLPLPPPVPPSTLPPPPPADHPCRCSSCGHILPIWGCDQGCACLYSEPEPLEKHKAHECSPVCTPRWSQALVNCLPGSAEPCPYCVKYAAGRCMGVDDFPDQETLQQQRRRELEAQQVSTAPPPPPPPSGGSGLLQAFDEGEVPYFFTKDTARTLAAKSELLDTSVTNPEWMAAVADEAAAEEKWPPERSEYNLGERGQRAYRRDRAQWYREHTGKELAGSVAEQNDQWDDYKRNFRARNERERAVQPVANPPPPEPERYAGPPGHYLYD